MEKIIKVDLRKEIVETPEGKSHYQDFANIENDGILSVGSFDFGPEVDKKWGHDYEYDIKIEKEWKDTIVLLLIQEHFKTASDFKKWLDDKGVPSKTSLW